MDEGKNWFGTFFNSVKSKSSEVFELVKNDIEEIGNAVKNEASSVVSSTGSVLERTMSLTSADSTASTMKRSFTTFLDQMSSVFNPTLDESDTEDILIFQGSELVTPNKLQQAIIELQSKEDTYLSDPVKEHEKVFQCWLEINEENLSVEKTKRYLKNSVVLQKNYDKLVPKAVSDELFWKRYLFKKALLEDEINREEEKLEREKIEVAKQDEINEKSAEQIEWESEDFSHDIELSEEEQIKLLEEYENETKQRKSQGDQQQSSLGASSLKDELSDAENKDSAKNCKG